MSRSNPLFIDSTKSNHDGIGTQIELNGVILHDGERVRCEVKDQAGQKRQIFLLEEGDGRFCGQIWLKHQEEIDLKFMIEDDQGRPVAESPVLRRQASYALIETWQTEKTKKRAASKPKPKVEKSFTTQTPLTDDKLGKLIAKWGL